MPCPGPGHSSAVLYSVKGDIERVRCGRKRRRARARPWSRDGGANGRCVKWVGALCCAGSLMLAAGGPDGLDRKRQLREDLAMIRTQKAEV